jgi:hypothetical protein
MAEVHAAKANGRNGKRAKLSLFHGTVLALSTLTLHEKTRPAGSGEPDCLVQEGRLQKGFQKKRINASAAKSTHQVFSAA